MFERRLSAQIAPALFLLFAFNSVTHAQAVKPWFMVVFDTSGSMETAAAANSCGFPATRMGAAKCAMQNILNQTGDAEFGLTTFAQNGCSAGAGGGTTCDNTAASGMLRAGISATPTAMLGLVDGAGAAPAAELCSGGYTPLGGSLLAARSYFTAGGSPTASDAALGCRPINLILLTDGEERCASCSGSWEDCPSFDAAFPGAGNNCSAGCTTCSDSGSGCFETAPEAAYDMFAGTSVPTGGSPATLSVRIKTYVIGFGIASGNARIERIALGGGTDNSSDGSGGLLGFYATDEAEISEALARIIFESQLNEVCNGVDDDCDDRVDEGSQAYCDPARIRSANPLVPHPVTGAFVDQSTTVSVEGTASNLAPFTCSLAGSMCVGLSGPALITCCANTGSCCAAVPFDTSPPMDDLAICAAPEWANKIMCSPLNRLCESPGEKCDGVDNDCDGDTDEGPFVGTVPPELCNNSIDDDCDGNTDEGCASCVPETCDGDDDDCDGFVDEELNRPCGFDLGPSFPASICRNGEQTCVLAQWGAVCPSGTTGGPTCSAVVTRPNREVGDPFPTGWVNGGGTCVLAVPEICDNFDNNCNTLVNDIPPVACTSGTIPLASLPRGICTPGLMECDPSMADLLGPCEFEVLPQTEICNGLDDDCDGFTDEAPGSMMNASLTRPCGTDAGICVRGVERCIAGMFQNCNATGGMSERCNAVSGAPDQTLYDEDCDTRIDESDPAIPGACVPNAMGGPVTPGPDADRGECALGAVQCIAGALRCSNYVGPTPELCDVPDRDCDGNANNGVGPTTANPTGPAGTDPTLGTFCFPASYPGFTDALPGVGRCTPGRRVCNTATSATSCVNFGTPMAEACNGLDDDCDGAVDEDVYDASDTCQSTPPHAPPRAFCGECVSANGSVVVCGESLVDDIAGMPTTCQMLGYGDPMSHGGVSDCCDDYTFTSSWAVGNLVGPHDGDGECSLGLQRCINGAPLCDGEVLPVEELCDGRDNDCDGQADEFLPTEGQFCGSDTGVCERGRLVCTGASGMQCMSQTLGTAEQCNGLDDDCNGFVDEGNPGGGALCGGNTANCMRRMDPTDTAQAETEPCGDCDWGVEICVTQFDPGGLPTGGQIQCLGDTGPRDELCDGRDNDCDSLCRVESDGTIICPPDTPDADDKIDEGADVTDPNVGEPCGEDEGECESGELVCTGGGLVCNGGVGPLEEICNALDDDCDGISDDGIPVGAPCGEDEGECAPGVLVCDPTVGMTVCQGGIGPSDEICDGLDNDCDGVIDNGLGVGEPCGSDEGECGQGTVQCVGGRERCVGEQVPTPEICDCLDNDCDGNLDEGGSICGGGAACVMCQCALPCTDPTEFAVRCPQGKAPIENDEGCHCVGEVCRAADCAEETIEVSGEVACAPEHDRVGTCVCKNNECTFRCSGVSCGDELVCDATDGRCKEATCLLPQFACADGQRCGLLNDAFTCIEDECADVRCDDDEACVRGDCVKSCGRVECGAAEVCAAGECTEDLCPRTVRCAPGDVCDPANGDCVPAGACVGTGCVMGRVCDPVGGECEESVCLSTRCPPDEMCDPLTGECELRCGGGLLFCGTECINPESSREHCGASGDCTGDNAGEQCPEGLACSRGRCSENCDEGLVNCGGDCIDPKRDILHCGASDDCEGNNAGDVCQTNYACEDGRCVRTVGPDGPGGGAGDDVQDGTRVIVSGGGGCTCSVPGAAEGPSGSGGGRGPLALALVGLALAWLGRRRRVLAAGPLLVVLAALSALGGSGCKVDTFCLDCPDPNEDPTADGGGINGGNAGRGGAGRGGSGSSGRGGTGGASGDGTGGTDAAVTPDACVDSELCNGLDDDCDGTTDEGVDPSEVGIDVATDPLHCGGCGQACVIPHAFNRCEDSVCRIDRGQGDNGCDTGYVDLDGDEANGCEHRCTKTMDEDRQCDLVDNDCDGQEDEDVEFATDPNNCGSCGFTCRFANAAAGGTCVAGDCVLDASQCDEGFRDLDGVQGNGCERRCSRFPTVDEECNLADDDCDGLIDEGVGTTDPLVGVDCGTDAGECEAGTTACVVGAIACEGETRPTTEVCDGDDNDCDDNTDESDPLLSSNPACGSSIGACERGVLQCVNGARVCGGGTFVGPAAFETCNRLDDDCDGLIDEESVIDDQGTMRALADDIACSMRSGMLDITPTASAVGICEHGTLACVSGQLVCGDEVLPSIEKCDNLDRDCDGTPVPADLGTLDDDALGIVCSNQLGICGAGTPGRTVCNNTGTSGSPNWQVQCSAGSVTPEPTETCDGQDDDCDGRFDENATGTGANNCHLVDNNMDGVRETYVAAPLDHGACDSGDTFCTGGSFACIGFVGPTPESCNGVNDDCDANENIDEGAQFAGTPCNVLSGTIGSTNTWNLFGVCTAGTWSCPANPAMAASTGLQCVGGVRPAASESCNSLDDDCDGSVDELWVAMGGQPQPGSACCPNDPSTPHVDMCNAAGPAFSSCRPGMNQCAGGAVSCIQTAFSPGAEICDLGGTQRDNDCDGNIDEGFRNGAGVYTNIDNCGGCGPVFDCRAAGNQIDNAIMGCVAGSCEIVTCDSGFYDDPNSAGLDCDIECPFFAGAIELCDGEDNDCDGDVDEAPLQAPVASSFCDQDGRCANSFPVCIEIAAGVKGWSCNVMPAASETCDFSAGSPGVSNVDEDCDGVIDEDLSIEAGFTPGTAGVGVNRECFGPGEGDCQGTGRQVCDGDNATNTTCVVSLSNLTPVTENTAASDDEVCNGDDDDCDGEVDEPCEDAGGLCMPNDTACITANTDTRGTPSTADDVLGCIIDSWAQLDSDTWIYAHEASRADATSSTQGSSEERACAGTNRRPWTSISYDEALDACESAGARLCSRSEWRQACSCGGTGTTGTAPNYDFAWPSFGSSTPTAGCTNVPATATTSCNIADATGTIDATGASANCRFVHMGTSVYDLTGNIKELTAAQETFGGSPVECDPTLGSSNCRIQVRGGASSNTAVGSACGFDRSFWPADAPFYNVGFRCCSGPDPLPTKCVVAAGPGGTASPAGANLSRSVVLDGSGITSISEVQVTFTGMNNDFDDLTVSLARGATSATVINMDPCSNNQNGNLNVSFTDAAAGLPTISGGCGDMLNGGTFDPAAPGFGVFDTLEADSTWTLTFADNDGDDTATLTSWSLRVCGTE